MCKFMENFPGATPPDPRHTRSRHLPPRASLAKADPSAPPLRVPAPHLTFLPKSALENEPIQAHQHFSNQPTYPPSIKFRYLAI